MMGTLSSTVFLALCPAMGNAFVVRAAPFTPTDSAWNRQASASSLGGALEIGGRGLGIDGDAFSGVGGNGAQGYAAWCGRSKCPFHVFKGVQEPGVTEGGNATVPHRGGVGRAEGADWGIVPAVPQREGLMQHRSSGHVTVMPHELSSLTNSFGDQWSASAAASECGSTQGGGVGGQHNDTGSTHAAVTTLEDKVDHAMRSMLHNAFSGRPASNAAILDDNVNEAIGSMLHAAFFGRVASHAVSSMHVGGGGGSEDAAGAGGLRVQEPTISEVGTKAVTDDDSMRVSYDDFVRAASETHVDWGQVKRNSEAALARKAGKGRRQWMSKLWGRVRRKGW